MYPAPAHGLQAPDPPDVWIQLLRHLLRDAACREALLERSRAAIATSLAPAEFARVRLAVSLAGQLAQAAADAADPANMSAAAREDLTHLVAVTRSPLPLQLWQQQQGCWL
jgi:hypothetical protein